MKKKELNIIEINLLLYNKSKIMILYFKIHHIRMVNVVTYLHENGNIFLNNEKNLIY